MAGSGQQQMMGEGSLHEMSRTGMVGEPQVPFEQVTIYDAPGVLMGQILNDSVTFKSIKDTFLTPNNLTPRQRETVRASIFGESPDGVMKTVQGIVTNPWIWMYFLTSSVGVRALRQHGAGSLFKQGKAFNAWMGKNVPFWAHLLPTQEAFSHMNALAMETGAAKTAGMAAIRQVEVGAEAALVGKYTKMGLKLNPEDPFNYFRYAEGTREREVIRSLATGEHIANSAGTLENPLRDRVASLQSRAFVKTRDGTTTALGEGEVQRLLKQGEWPGKASEMIRGAEIGELENLQRMVKQEGFEAWKQLPRRAKKAWKGTPEEWVKQKWEGWREYGVANRPQFHEQPFIRVKELGDKEFHLATDEGLAQLIDEAGGKEAWDFIEAKRKARKTSFVMMIGDDSYYAGTGHFRVDEEKVKALVPRLRTGMRNFQRPGDVKVPMSTSTQGLEVMYSLIGQDEVTKALGHVDDATAGKKLLERLESVVGGAIEQDRWASGAWMSRNTFGVTPVTALADGKRMLPLPSLDEVTARGADEVMNSVMAMRGGQMASVVDGAPIIHVDDLEWLKKKGILPQQTADQYLPWVREKAQKRYQESGAVTMGLRLDGHRSHVRSVNSMVESSVMDTMTIQPRGASLGAPGALKSDEEWIQLWKQDPNSVKELEGRFTKIGMRDDVRVTDSVVGRGDVTLGDLWERAYSRIPNVQGQKLFREVMLPGALHRAGPQYLAAYVSEQRARSTAEWFTQSFIGQSVKKYGGKGGKELFERMEKAANPFEPLEWGGFDKGLTKWLYASHLALNLGSVMLNLTQPFLLATTMADPETTAKALGKTLKEFWTYGVERAKLGMRPISDVERRMVQKKAFSHAAFGHMDEDLLHMADQGLDYAEHGLGNVNEAVKWQQKPMMDRVFNFMMKPFEKSEQFNRVFTGHLVEGQYRKAGVDLMDFANQSMMASDIKRGVETFQFASTLLNQPALFARTSGSSGILNNPLTRMFTTFPIRMMTTAFYTLPRMGGSDNAWKQGVSTFVRSMGMSAFLYEATKGLLGADISRGLYFKGVTDLAGGDRMSRDGGSPIPIPPVVQIPWDLMSGAVQGDVRMMASAFSRTIPGGVAAMRALNALPEMPVAGPQALGLQQTSVGWDQVTPEGMVPIFRSDGSLVEWKSRSEVVAKALGVDMGAWQKQGALDGYLVKQRDRFITARHDLLRAIGSNDIGRAMRIKKQFEREHGVPLTVGGQQVKAYLQSLSTTRTQRTLNTFPKEIRPSFEGMAASTKGTTMARALPSDQQIQEMMRRVKALEAVGPASRQAQPASPSFPTFSSQ